MRSLKEFCGVVAIWRDKEAAASLLHRGLFALQHRGQEAAGIVTATNQTADLHHLKGRGLVVEGLPTYEVKKLPGNRGIGHVRYSTVALDRSENIQPFLATTPYGNLAIAHNGNFKNATTLQSRLESDGALLSTTMDTELLVHLIARSKANTFAQALRLACQEVVGAYSLTMICEGRLYGFRDPHGIRPLVLGRLEDGWMLASESCALAACGATYEREIKAGELICIGPDGVHSTQLIDAEKPAGCVFELVYFSRPDSEVFGQGVHGARVRMGQMLAEQDAEEFKNEKPDIVVPVPDSGFPAALGYARHSQIPFEKAIIRSHYVGRTFILPDQDLRSHTVRLKLSVIREAVEGKTVLLVDDSIVRGNTSKLIVEMVREAGAKAVWMRIASAPLHWPCYLGIDTPSHDELLANREKDVAGVESFVGADNLRYLSVENLKKATQQQSMCFACMDGKYPV